MVGKEREVRERERGKPKSIELDPTIRTKFMVKADFLNFGLYLGWLTFDL